MMQQFKGVDLPFGNILALKEVLLTKVSPRLQSSLTDTQSTLEALAVGPKQPYKYLGIDTSPS
jgi:hypothetical protein